MSHSPNRADSAPYASSVVNGHDALHLTALDETPQAFRAALDDLVDALPSAIHRGAAGPRGDGACDDA